MVERTQEFRDLVEALSVQLPGGKKPAPARKPLDASRSAFRESTSLISGQIHRTSQNITALTKLVRRQGLFDDPTDEINNLIFRIKEDLGALNTKCDEAQSYVNEQKRLLGDTNQAASYSVNVVGQLRSDLMSTTKDFKSILEVRTSKMKTNQDRKVKLTGNAALSPMKQLTTASAHSKELHVPANKMQFYNPYLLADQANLVESGQASHIPQEQQLLLAPPDATMQYYASREQAVNEVEKTIQELGQIFHRLASMISEQGALVDRVDEDVENAVSNTDRARELLMRTYESVSSNRALYTKVFAIFAIFIVFFILFML